jgi:hypothetical protein
MLAIGIQGDHNIAPGLGKPGIYGPEISRTVQSHYPGAVLCLDCSRVIGATVIHHQDFIRMQQRILDHLTEARGLIIGRYDHRNFGCIPSEPVIVLLPSGPPYRGK